jgi:hypothetical protein
MSKTSVMSFFRSFLPILLMLVSGCALAQSSDGTMSSTAVAAQNMQNRLFPQITVPMSYNLNNQLGANSTTKQAELGLGFIFPFNVSEDVQFLLNPFFTYNSNLSEGKVTNQTQPIQVASFFMKSFSKDWYFGLGPYVQGPANNANNGSLQTGVGVSGGGFYTPEHWSIGVIAYNSWGLGDNMTGGSANVFSAGPKISYTTDSAWTYSLSSSVQYNYNSKAATNQLTLSGGQTFKVYDYHMQWQIGPTYMVTTTPTSAKGWGAYAGLTLLMPK